MIHNSSRTMSQNPGMFRQIATNIVLNFVVDYISDMYQMDQGDDARWTELLSKIFDQGIRNSCQNLNPGTMMMIRFLLTWNSIQSSGLLLTCPNFPCGRNILTWTRKDRRDERCIHPLTSKTIETEAIVRRCCDTWYSLLQSWTLGHFRRRCVSYPAWFTLLIDVVEHQRYLTIGLALFAVGPTSTNWTITSASLIHSYIALTLYSSRTFEDTFDTLLRSALCSCAALWIVRRSRMKSRRQTSSQVYASLTK